MRAFVRCLGAICTKDPEVGNGPWEWNRLPTPPIKRKWRGISLIMTSFLRHHDSSATGGERAARPEPLFARPIHLSYDQVPDREREREGRKGRAKTQVSLSLSAGKLAALKREKGVSQWAQRERVHERRRRRRRPINRRINVSKK